MKKVLFILSAVAFIAVACQKNDVGRKDDFSDAPWATNPNLRVPIQIGMDNLFDVKTNTKAAIEDLAGVRFGVLVVDQAPTIVDPDEDWSVLLKDKIAVQGTDGLSQFVTADGTPITYFYPLETHNVYNYSFYAYRASDSVEEEAFVIGDDYKKEVELGDADILWAKSHASPLPNIDPEADDITGFNADYFRKARYWYPDSWENYKPILHFNHLTAALHFYVVAETAEAETTLTNVSVSDLTLYNVYTNAVLDVIEGTLTAQGDKGELDLSMDAPVVPVHNSNKGVECGSGFFILPTEDPMSVNFTINVPVSQTETGAETQPYRRTEPYVITPPVGGFQAGKSYRFRIIVRDLVDISAKMELEAWEWEPTDTDLLPAIGS